MKKAMILLEENNNTLDGILLVIHDELVESFDTNIAEDRSKITLQKMKEAGKLYCTSVQMEAETAVGSYWIH